MRKTTPILLIFLSFASATAHAADPLGDAVAVSAIALKNTAQLRALGTELSAANKENLYDWYSSQLARQGLGVSRPGDCQLFIRQSATSATPSSIQSCSPTARDALIEQHASQVFHSIVQNFRSGGSGGGVDSARGGMVAREAGGSGGGSGGGVD